jgi:hypothetical protein
MSELLHPGYHPDADQLSAFAEHALPEHERSVTLAHLAECSDCRQVVFLAQQATANENLAPKATPNRTPWFKSWNLLWPAAVALSCGLLIMVLRHGRKPADLPQQEVALTSKSPAPPVPPLQTPVPQSAAVARETAPKPLPKKALPLNTLKPASTLTTVGEASAVDGAPLSANQTQNNLRLQGRSILALTPQPADAMRAGTGSAHGAIVGAGSQRYPAAGPAALQTERQATFGSAQQALPPPPAQQAAAAPPPPAAASASTQDLIPRSVTQTVEVASPESAIQTESAVLNGGVLDSVSASPQKIASRSLPSKRLTASSISNGSETLAVDSAGDLFLSKDAGVNWQHIAQQWTGRAIKVTLTSPAAKKQLDASKATAGKTAASATNFGSLTPASSTKKSGFELTTDTGANWYSPDGLIWEKK